MGNRTGGRVAMRRLNGTTDDRGGRTEGPRQVRWGRVAALAIAGLCVVYAPIAMTDVWPYEHPGAFAPGRWVLAHSGVSPAYVAEALADRLEPYRRSFVPLLVHTVLGGVLMLLGPLQLWSAVRRRIRLHRTVGVVFTVTVYASMAGAAVYLARTPPAQAFSGAAFWVVLATILVGTVLSTTLGIGAALTGFPDLHQRWLLLCYGYLMTAPLLRLEWGALPLVLGSRPVAELNRVAIMHLGSIVTFGALAASRALDRRTTVRGMTGTWCPPAVLAAAQLVGAAGVVWLVRSFAAWGPEGRRLLLAYLIPLLLTYVFIMVRQRRTTGWAREEWRLHLAFLCLAPAFSAVAAPLFEHGMRLDGRTSLMAGVGIGCGMLAFAATAVVSLRVLYAREVTKRQSKAPAARPPSALPL
ncbi:DUF2306 domain-containing protein [Kitasatospora sp. NPDC059747]|uniref:DUF2306 domain-containing protein n=1 Tax=Kitasatospora sp. NPDC059747 TaxID=3346930 RepID=UPI00364D62AC